LIDQVVALCPLCRARVHGVDGGCELGGGLHDALAFLIACTVKTLQRREKFRARKPTYAQIQSTLKITQKM
jgi:hypothetical protein